MLLLLIFAVVLYDVVFTKEIVRYGTSGGRIDGKLRIIFPQRGEIFVRTNIRVPIGWPVRVEETRTRISGIVINRKIKKA